MLTGHRHFSCKIPYKVALVKCCHACRLRRLVQSVCLLSGLTLGRVFFFHFFCKFLYQVARAKMLKCISAGQACTTCGPRLLGAAFFPVDFRKNWLV